MICNIIDEATNEFNCFYELEKEKNKDDCTYYFDISSYTNEILLVNDVFTIELFDKLKNANNKVRLYFYGFDQIRQNINTIGKILSREIKKIAIYKDKLYIRIISSSSLWDYSLENCINEIWPNNYIKLYIAPYTLSQVKLILEEHNLDSNKYINILNNNELQPLTLYPYTFNKILKYNIENIITDDITLNELYHNICIDLCNVGNLTIQHVSPNVMFGIATRIAALMLFCRKEYISTRYIEDNCIHVSHIFEEDETNENYKFRIKYADIIQTIIFSGLFFQKHEGIFYFHNKSIQDYLAAKFIINHEYDKNKIISLFTNSKDKDGKLYDWITGVYNWLQKIKPSIDILEYFVTHDPLHTLESDIYNDSFKEKLVENILNQFDNITEIDYDKNIIKNYGYKLKHPTILKQIKPYIIDKNKNNLVRQNAIIITEVCNIIEAEELLWNIIKDENEEGNIKTYAIHSLVNMDISSDIKNEFLSLDWTNFIDERDEIRGCILNYLLSHKLISYSKALHLLTYPQKSNYYGSYKIFLDFFLPKSLGDIFDIDSAIEWLEKFENIKEYSSYVKNPYNNIIAKIIDESWSNFNNLKNKYIFCNIINRFISNYIPIFPEKNRSSNTLFKNIYPDIKIRFHVANYILNSSNNVKGYPFFHSKLITNDDFNSIADYLSHSNEYDLSKWETIFKHFNYNNLQIEVEKIKKLFPIIYQGIITESKNRNERNIDNSQQVNINHENNYKVQLLNNLKLFAEYKEAYYWESFIVLLKENSISIDSFIKDTENNNRSDLTKLSKYYIENFEDEFYERNFNNSFNIHSIAGYESFLILALFNEIEYINNLSGEILKKWYKTLLYGSNLYSNYKNENRIIQTSLLKKIPDESTKILYNIILYENKKYGYLFSMDIIENNYNNTSKILLELIESLDKLEENVIVQILSSFFEHKPRFIYEYIKNTINENKYNSDIKTCLLSILLFYTDDYKCDYNFWEYLSHFINENNDTIYKKLVNNFNFYNQITTHFNEEHLALLYSVIHRLFPPNEDPIYEGAHRVTIREKIASLRNALIETLKSKGTENAINEIEKLKDIISGTEIKYHLITAKKIFRNSQIEKLSPSAFQRLSHNGQFRIISNSYDLLNLIIESLDRLNKQLHGTQPMIECLWDITNDKQKPKDEEHLSNFIASYLSLDLNQYAIYPYRETELRRKSIVTNTSSGEKTDIIVDYLSKKIRVIIEVKCSWNTECKTNMEQQLAKRYMQTDDCKCGLYIIGWYYCENDTRNKTGCKSIEEAKIFYDSQAKLLSKNGFKLDSYILDCTLK